MSNEKAFDSAGGAGTLVQPRYSRGLLLEDDDLTAGVTYTRDLMRLMFRSLFGCGVICGLKVATQLECNNSRLSITVQKGLGLDCLGNPIEVTKTETLKYEPQCMPIVPTLWVLACYREKTCRPKEVTCSNDEEEQVVQTRVCGGYELSVVSARPKCACSCEPPQDKPARTDDECCGNEQRAAQAANTAERLSTANGQGDGKKDYCDCYRKHYNFECDCDCGCKCIVIARIDITTSGGVMKSTAMDPRVPRFIRPELIGNRLCKGPRGVIDAVTEASGGREPAPPPEVTAG